MKKILLGMILGIFISSTTLIFAAEVLKVTNNSFPILKDGTEVKLSAKNINGSTYLKLRDASTLLNIPITFENKKIYIGSMTPVADNEIKPFYIEKVKYVLFKDIEAQITRANITCELNESESTMIFSKNNTTVSTKYMLLMNNKYIIYDFYEKSIMPMLK
ncbi:MAG: hypothetical protein Q8942_05235 [Bacillota bacterium]|nr:hypothetical protein [Bacillota bacterium]